MLKYKATSHITEKVTFHFLYDTLFLYNTYTNSHCWNSNYTRNIIYFCMFHAPDTFWSISEAVIWQKEQLRGMEGKWMRLWVIIYTLYNNGSRYNQTHTQ